MLAMAVEIKLSEHFFNQILGLNDNLKLHYIFKSKNLRKCLVFIKFLLFYVKIKLKVKVYDYYFFIYLLFILQYFFYLPS